MDPKPRIFIFGWPSFLGGADTKLAHLLVLLHDRCEITVIPNEGRHLHSKTWTKFLQNLGVKFGSSEKFMSGMVETIELKLKEELVTHAVGLT